MGIMRGQRCVRSMQSPADGLAKPWEAGPVGIASLACPAGHGDEVKGRKALEGMKKQGAGASHCNFLTPKKLDYTPKIFGFVVFVAKNILFCAFGKDEVSSSNLDSSSTERLVPQGLKVIRNYYRRGRRDCEITPSFCVHK